MGLVTCLPESEILQINDWREGWLSVSLPILSVPEMGKVNLRFACVSKVMSSGHSETPKKIYKVRESVNVSCYRHCKAVGDTSHW